MQIAQGHSPTSSMHKTEKITLKRLETEKINLKKVALLSRQNYEISIQIKETDALTVILLVAGRNSCFFTLLFDPMSIEPLLIDEVAIGQILFNCHADGGSATGIPTTVGRHV
jgi:hypothetical protein